ncbi:MAG: DUF5606 domain-containing protein [Bacteroidaceae bacterium]|nr:DUF5606 domain-containing protein [Bacteroidaceae bacterium]
MLTLNYVLAISGKPGLYQLISRGKNMLIVEAIDATKKRQPVYAADKVISLADIAMYTDNDEIPLKDVLESLKKKENGAVASINPSKASKAELFDFFAQVLPDFDRDRVYPNDIQKLIKWYSILIENGITEFIDARDEMREAAEKAQAEAEAKKAEEAKEEKPAKKAAAKKTTKKADEAKEEKPAKKTAAKKATAEKKPAAKKTTATKTAAKKTTAKKTTKKSEE